MTPVVELLPLSARSKEMILFVFVKKKRHTAHLGLGSGLAVSREQGNDPVLFLSKKTKRKK
jgi:hypothetical protein